MQITQDGKRRFSTFQNIENPLVSVIITARNEKATIEPCLKSIFEQSYSNFEVIYIDAKSSDGTFEKARALTDYSKSFRNCKRYLAISSLEANSPGKGRNFGASLATGKIIAFTDADCIAESDWLENILKHLPEEGGVVGGPNILRHFKSLKILDAIDKVLGTYLGSGGSWQYRKVEELSEVTHGPLPACNLAIQKSLFNEVSGFNERLRYNEDTDFCNRIRKYGYRIMYTPEARVNHFIGIESYSDFLKFLSKYGLERGRNAVRNPDLLTKSMFNVFSVVLVFVLFLLLSFSFFIPVASTVLISLLLGIFLLIFAASIKIAIANKSPLLAFLAIPIFISIHIIYNAGFVNGYLLSLISPKKCV